MNMKHAIMAAFLLLAVFSMGSLVTAYPAVADDGTGKAASTASCCCPEGKCQCADGKCACPDCKCQNCACAKGKCCGNGKCAKR